jgi:hypothetical protein
VPLLLLLLLLLLVACVWCVPLQFLCCELIVWQQTASPPLAPLRVVDAASAAWRLGVAASLQTLIPQFEQVR